MSHNRTCSRPGRRAAALASALVLPLALASTFPVCAATGGPDALGTTWADERDGCPVDPPTFTASAMRWNDPATAVGPVALGFAAPFARDVVQDVWISPTGFLAFSDQGPDGASATTQLLPDPAAPNHLLAPFWRPVPVRSITAEAFPDRFEVEWTWDGGGPSGQESVWLTLHRDGRARFLWGTGRFSNADATVGYEDTGGAAGTTWWRDGTAVEPGFFQPIAGRSLCLTPPVLLDCSAPAEAVCGDTVDLDLPATAPEEASVYTCAPGVFPGNEQVLRVDVARPRPVSVTLDLPEADLFQVPGPPDCSEASCLAHGDQQLAFPILFQGSHWFAVDTTTPGGGVRVSAQVSCEELTEASCGLPLAGTTMGGSSAESSYACVPATLDGPEAHVLLTTASDGHLAATLAGAPAGMWVVLRDAAGACLAAGEGGATAFDAPAGTYVVTVDAEAGVAADFTLETGCGTRLDCAGAGIAQCNTTVAGDTSASATEEVGVYACSDAVSDGAEDLYLLHNPRDQILAARFLSNQPGQEAYLLSSCDEGDCVFGRLQGGCALLPAGDYLLVVDGPSGSEGEYELEVECRRISTPGVDIAIVELDASGMPTDCRSLEAAGALAVTLSNEGDAVASPPFDVIAFLDEDGTGDYESPGADVLLGTVSVADPVPPGETLGVAVPVAGTLPFRDGVVHAKVDPARVLPDRNRTNEILDTGAGCVVPAAPPEDLSLRLEWEWTESVLAPTFVDVESVPLVGDLDGDGLPEVIVGGQECCGGPNTGMMLHALSGRDGGEIWAADSLSERFAIATAPALGDLDGDGLPEIVGQSFEDTSRLLALDAGGSLLWTSDSLPLQSPFDTWGGAAAIADIDGDGTAEVVWGPNVVGSDGSLFWTPEAGGTLGSPDGGPVSVVADLDGDGLQEVIAGPTAYSYDAGSGMGSILWTNSDVPDGYAAVGEVDGDAGAEILVAEHGRLHLLEGEDGALAWTAEIPEGGGASCGGISGLRGGPPSLFDLDGDGRAEIGVMGADWFAVFNGDGTERWRAPVAECSSGITSATAFDLDGDGSLEIVLKDQEVLRILRGFDGAELLSEAGTSGTSREMPVVADLDSDGQAEILVVENRLLGGAGVGLTGARAFGSGGAPWRGARAVWNQHAYHVTNIEDDLTVPAPSTLVCAPPSPLAEGTFRVQRPRPLPGPLGPDLTVTLIEAERLDVADCMQELRITVRVGNAGGAPVGGDFPVAFFDDAAGGALLALPTAIDLLPGDFTDITEVVGVSSTAPAQVRIAADDDGAGGASVLQCREDNDDCTVTDADLGGAVPDRPADIGAALRASGHGPATTPDVTADFEWTLDEGGPRTLGTGSGEEHFHFYRAVLDGGPPAFTFQAVLEPLLAPSTTDASPRTAPAELPRVHGYLVVAADACEAESEN